MIEDLLAVLAAHQEWLEGDPRDPEDSRRANLCNADLTGEELGRVNLSMANLSMANLEGADLSGAILEEVDLHGAYLVGVNLEGAQLNDAHLERATLEETNLQRAILEDADLEEAKLYKADLEGSNLLRADLRGADLLEANLAGADLRWAILIEAKLVHTGLADAKLFGAKLLRAQYEPSTPPDEGWLSGLEGLRSVRFCPGREAALVQLREALKRAGLRGLERETTYAIESLRTDYALKRWNRARTNGCPDLARDRRAAIEGAFRLIFFELATDYGLAYGRPILILLCLIGVFTLFYLPAVLRAPKQPNDGGIFRLWPQGRIEQRSEHFEAAADVTVEPLRARGLSALWYAFHFSVISAFHLGWRDLNVGAWIARLQPREYVLRAKGWPRAVSGVQSLISVYLVAMWALTYFGRPFG